MRLLAKIFVVLAGGLMLVAAVLVIGAYTFLPSMVEGVVARNLESNLGLSRTPEVSLSAEPAYEILAGNFDSGEVVLREPEFAGVRPERVRMELNGFEVDVARSVREGGPRVDEPLAGEIRVVLSEGELERIAKSGIESVPVRRIGISEDSLTVGSSARVLGVDVPISVRGPVNVEGGEIVFAPEEAAAFGTRLPASVTDRILSGTDFGYPVEDLPFNGEVTGIEIGEGTLALEGSVRDLPIS
ncbi:hypothetical protein BH24ACT16_BH24ACT16_02600 [soil metagenome]|jgi:hypothetical protein